VDASNCLGQNVKGMQRAYFKSKVYPNHYFWFPKFYENEEWDNNISEDEETIFSNCKDVSKQQDRYNKFIKNTPKRIVFPRYKDNLGFILYKFKGIYEPDIERSSPENGTVCKRIATRIDINR